MADKSVKKINSSEMPFAQRENIQAFCDAVLLSLPFLFEIVFENVQLCCAPLPPSLFSLVHPCMRVKRLGFRC